MIHRRQFVIAARPLWIKPDWVIFELSRGMLLSSCPELQIKQAVDRDRRMWTLVGHAFQADPKLPDPTEQITRLPTEEVPVATYSWSGRWVLVGHNRVIPDAAGLLGVFYWSRTDGEWLVSNSLAILSQLAPELRVDPRRLGWHGLNWFPTPSSKLNGVKKLLPDQTLSPKAGTISYLKRTFPERYSGLSSDERAQFAFSYLTKIFSEISQREGKIQLVLTAGLDSRANLAAALASGAKVAAFTMEHPRITIADKEIPQRICNHLGVEYSYLQASKFDREREALYDAHTLGNTNDADRYLFAHGVFDGLGTSSWLIRSGCWEIGRCFFYKRFHGLTLESIRNNPDPMLWRFRTFGNLRRSAQYLGDWITWRDMHREPFDWKDLFYRDQRLAGWLSSIEQSLDLLNCVSIQPINCAALFDLVLSEQEALRQTGALQKRVVELSKTELGPFPINPELDSILVRRARKAKVLLDAIFCEVKNAIVSH